MLAILLRVQCHTSRLQRFSLSTTQKPTSFPLVKNRWLVYTTSAAVIAVMGVVAFETSRPFRHTIHAIMRCSRVAGAAMLGAIDYKWTFARDYPSERERQNAHSLCHKRSALRVRRALLSNGGVFIKMGQHLASLYVLPKEWPSVMRPLQDQCEPTPFEDIEGLFLQDMNIPTSEIFSEFDQKPIGVASLAQVHVARMKNSGRLVAVKLQHPRLAEFCDIDMRMVEVVLGCIGYLFPDFEFTWLGEEMRTNLPKEMNFVLEADNAARVARDFEHVSTSLYIPEVIMAKKRVLIMEYIQGGRVDDLAYLASHNINRNKVALELCRIFSQMVFVNGWFHADPHPGNLLIRPTSPKSKSPHNFEVVLLDHGLYFDIDTTLRVNYTERRKYAELVGNITPDLYPVFESAMTGRVGLQGTWDDAGESSIKRASSVMSLEPQTEEEMDAIRNAVIGSERLLLSVFDVLRRVPRRVLMVLKLNDLTRSLDHALATTHSEIRVFLITAKYCAYAVWQHERRRLLDAFRDTGFFPIKLMTEYIRCWWTYGSIYGQMSMLEIVKDLEGSVVQLIAWCKGLRRRGFIGAYRAASGLDY